MAKKNMMQRFLDNLQAQASQDSNTEAQGKAQKFLDVWAMAEEETKRKQALQKTFYGGGK